MTAAASASAPAPVAGTVERFWPGRRRLPVTGSTAAACSNASSPTRGPSTSGAVPRRPRRRPGVSGVASAGCSGVWPVSRSKVALSRSGTWCSGVAVMTSRPNRPSRSRAVAPRRRPTRRPRAGWRRGSRGCPRRRACPRRPRAASGCRRRRGRGRRRRRPGRSCRRRRATWRRPPAGRAACGCRTRAARAARRSRPCRRCRTRRRARRCPTAPGMSHHSRAATTTARAMRSRPMPSRRCSGSRSRPVSPTLRATAPVAWARPIQVLCTARSGSGRPPERARLDPLRERAAGRRVAGRVVELRPRAEEDVRVAMGAGYARVTRDSRVTRGTAVTEKPRNEVRARTEARRRRSGRGSGRTRPPARRIWPTAPDELHRRRVLDFRKPLLGCFLTRTLPCLYSFCTHFFISFPACPLLNP